MDEINQQNRSSEVDEMVSYLVVDEYRLKLAMLRAGIKTERELAKRAKCAPTTITAIKEDGNCTMHTLGKIGKALGRNAIDLLVTKDMPAAQWLPTEEQNELK